MKFNMRLYGFIVGLLFILLSWAQTFFINYLIPLGLVAIGMSVINILVVKKRLNEKFYRSLLGISVLFTAIEILWMIFDKIGLYVVAQVLLVLIGITLTGYALGIYKKLNRNFKSIVLRIGAWIPLIVLISISAFLIFFIISPKPVTLYLQRSTGAENYFIIEPSTTKTIDGKYQLTTNIQYGEKYPRSSLNIITPKGQFDKNRPTYFYVHGGGFIMGDSMQGDPNAELSNNATLYHYEKMIDYGYNVVTINYALAPQYVHPTPVIQLTEAVQFMQKNGEKFGINMDDVVFAGGSSGGFIVTEFTTIQANPKFAKQIGIDPIIQLKNIKALVLESPALDAYRGHKTVKESVMSDYIFGQSLAAYIHQPVISTDKEMLDLLNLIPKATSDFPPTFISDGNTGTFADQAEDYYNQLKELGVKTDLYIPDIAQSEEGHGFMVHNIEGIAAQTYVERKLDFLESLE
ncbi:alpha/beta hydrolase [Paenibacillus xylanexedens]|uniref:alpha/beta hydrolase n=1 Tax=Paenibacillus xylanexedens TaxID=528191 RepID=UPI0011A15417|nr:alpha/beta hydrolase fold domain-containing protein [Paenibacillus xylanexedens]